MKNMIPGQSHSSLSPLHYTLLKNFPLVCFQVTHEISQLKIHQTKEEVHLAIEEILKNKGTIPLHLTEYGHRIQSVINEKIYKKNNMIFYHELPEGWENYLRNAINTLTLNSIKREEYKAIYEEVIFQVKQNKKIQFSEIYTKLTLSKTGLGNGIAKINSQLKEKFGIEIIKIGSAGNILFIKKIKKVKIKSVPIDFFIKTCETINKINSEHLYIINKSFRNFFFSIAMKGNQFKIIDFIHFVHDEGIMLTESEIRAAFGNYKKNLERFGIYIRKNENYSIIDFDETIFQSYFISKDESDKFQREIYDSIPHQDREFVQFFSENLIHESLNHTFFHKETFLDDTKGKYDYHISTINDFCSLLLKKGILMKGGKSLYYINKNYFHNTNLGINP